MSFHPLKENTKQERYIKYFLSTPVVTIDSKNELRCVVCRKRPVFGKMISIIKEKPLVSFEFR